MATCTAQKTGNWSDPTVWDTVPSSGDTVEAGGYSVTIDVDVNIGSGTLQNTGGGYYSVTAAGIDVVANVTATGASGCLRFSNSTGTTTLQGNVVGGGVAGVYGVSKAGNGTLTITGNITGGSANGAYGLYAGGGTVNVVGAVTGGSNYGYGVQAVSGTVNITGDCTGGGTGSHGLVGNGATLNVIGNCNASSGAHGLLQSSGTPTVTITGDANGSSSTYSGVYNNTASTITISGTATGGSGSGAAAHNQTTGTLTVTTAVAGSGGPGLHGQVSGGVTRCKVATDHATGRQAMSGFVKLTDDATNKHTVYRATAGSTDLVPGGGGGGSVIGSGVIVASGGDL
jgi:hypothetical protein